MAKLRTDRIEEGFTGPARARCRGSKWSPGIAPFLRPPTAVFLKVRNYYVEQPLQLPGNGALRWAI